jgi:hypothetical protein
MDVSEKKSTKVASQLPWRVRSIDNLEKTFRTLEKYYYKESLEDTITTANELGKIYQFKK